MMVVVVVLVIVQGPELVMMCCGYGNGTSFDGNGMGLVRVLLSESIFYETR